MASDEPIDIQISKFLEWLISRHHCKNGWQSQLSVIREKINTALQDMPEHKGIAELLLGSYINYFHCCQIIEILKETEADSKNLFGMYGSKRMKDWQDIVRLYQKDNVHLAESANILLRNVKYEVPNVKKQLTKFKQFQQECDKKMSDYSKSISSAQRELETMKKQFGVVGINVRNELLERTSHLDEVNEKVVSNVKSLGKAVQYYFTFTKHIAGVAYSLPLLSHVIEKGNTTTYEWLYGEPPQNADVVIENPVETSIDASTDEIDWDISVDDEEDYKNYDITAEESGIVVELPNKETNTVKNDEMYLVLDNPKTRDEFVNQLFELQSFLKMRLLETQKENSGLFVMNDIQESSENIVKMLDSVQVVKQLITDPINRQLHFIKHSKSYINKVAGLFDQKETAIEKMIASQKALKTRKEEAILNENELKPQLKLIMDKTRQLQEQVELEISKKYKNRPVYLIGGF